MDNDIFVIIIISVTAIFFYISHRLHKSGVKDYDIILDGLEKTKILIKNFANDYRTLESAAQNNLKSIEILSCEYKNLKSEMDLIKSQMMETREKQVEIREILSSKRPVIKMDISKPQLQLIKKQLSELENEK